MPDTTTRGAASDAALFTVAVYAGQALILVAGLVQKGLLGPKGAGYWALMQTAWTFLSLASLGAYHGSTRQVPIYRGRGDYYAAAATANSGISFSLLGTAVVGLLMSAVALVFGAGWQPEIRYGLALLGLIAPLRLFGDGHDVLLQATKRLDAASVGVITKAAIALVLQSVFVYFLGYYGMFLGFVTITLGLLLVYNRMGLISRRKPAFALRMERERVREVIAFGAPILVHVQIWLLFLAVDQLIVASFIDVRNLGFYALAASVTSYLFYLPSSIGAAVFPRLTEVFGRTRDIASIRESTTQVQRVLGFVLIPAFIGVSFFLAPVVIRYLLPEFRPAIPVVQIMMAGSFFIALAIMPIKLLLTAGYRWGIIAIEAFCLVVNGLLNYLAVAVLDRGIEGAAAATALSYFVLFLCLTSFGLGKAYPRREVLRQIGELIAAFAYTMAAVWGIESLLGGEASGVVADLLLGLGEAALFLVLLAPLLALAEARTQALTRMRTLFGGGARKLADAIGRRRSGAGEGSS